MEEKDYNQWMKVKKKMHNQNRLPNVREGDVWWCSVGENVGVEIDGKSQFFTRPVLVLKKFSRYGFLGVPLTSQPHEGAWYVSFRFQDKRQIAVLAQLRTFSAARLHNRLGTVPDFDLEMVRKGFDALFSW